MTHGFFKNICLMVALAFLSLFMAWGEESGNGTVPPLVNRKPPFLSGGAAWDSGFIPVSQGETKTIFHHGDTEDTEFFIWRGVPAK